LFGACVLYETIAAIKSNRCADASAWKLEIGPRSPALAFSSSIPFSRSTESSGCEHPRSTVKLTFSDRRRSGIHRQKLPGASPTASVPTSGGLWFEAERQLSEGFAVRQTERLDVCDPHQGALPASVAD
jgi:hypothetical protein